MYVPLSKRINELSINVLQYPETTDAFINQVSVAIIQYLEELQAMGYDGMEVSKAIMLEFAKGSDSHTVNPNRNYYPSDLYNLLIAMKNSDFLDLLDVAVCILYSCKSERRKWFCSEINSIMKMNGINLKVENGMCIRITEPFIQDEIIIPAFQELKDRRFDNAQEELWKAFDYFKKGDNGNCVS